MTFKPQGSKENQPRLAREGDGDGDGENENEDESGLSRRVRSEKICEV